jgi:uncharacterized membrane protein (DUF485 family)
MEQEPRDWAAVERTPEFQRLLKSRRRLMVGGTAFYTAYFVGFLLLLSFAKDTLAEEVAGSISVAMLAAVSLCLMTFVMAYIYAVKANGEWNTLVAEATASAERLAGQEEETR